MISQSFKDVCCRLEAGSKKGETDYLRFPLVALRVKPLQSLRRVALALKQVALHIRHSHFGSLFAQEGGQGHHALRRTLWHLCEIEILQPHMEG